MSQERKKSSLNIVDILRRKLCKAGKSTMRLACKVKKSLVLLFIKMSSTFSLDNNSTSKEMEMKLW